MFPFVRSPYNYDMNVAGDESGLKCLDATLTKQSFKEETDINTIVNRFHLTGELPTNVRAPTYADFTGVFDFHTAMNQVAQAREAFDQMPAEVRFRFNNDPAAFVDFCSQPDNKPEMAKMGLISAEAAATLKAATTPAPPPPVTPETAAKPTPEGVKAQSTT